MQYIAGSLKLQLPVPGKGISETFGFSLPSDPLSKKGLPVGGGARRSQEEPGKGYFGLFLGSPGLS